MVIVSDEINPNYENTISNALKAHRIIHRLTFNPGKALPGETLRIPVPKLQDGVVLVPGSLALIFNLDVKGQVDNYLVNNVLRALIDRMTVKYAGEILQDTDGFDLLKLYEDLFLMEKERANMTEYGIQSVELSRIRCNSGDKKTTGVNVEKKVE